MAASDTHVHKADPASPQFCRTCGEPMPGAEHAIAAAFEPSGPVPAASAAPTAAPVCIRCHAALLDGAACCEACGLPVTWDAAGPHQDLPAASPAPAPAAPQMVPQVASPAPVASPPIRVGRLKAVVRVNRDIHDRAAHPEIPAPFDPAAYTFEIAGPRAELGRALGDPAHDDAPNRILARDNAVSAEHATFERLADARWEIRDHSSNGTRRNGVRLARQDRDAPAGSGSPLQAGDVLWAGYYTEVEIVELD